MVMFKIYLRDNKQRIYRSFTTNNPIQAMEGFNKLVYRIDLDGKKLVAIMKYKNVLVAFHRFDVPMHHKNNLRGKTKDIYKLLSII